MARHSKNNSSLHHFTSAERAKLEYGTRKQRLGADSLRGFNDCYLCLQNARDPMCCSKGHISCKECVLESVGEVETRGSPPQRPRSQILAQTKEIERQKAAVKRAQQRQLDEEAQKAEHALQKKKEDFERAQLLVSDPGRTASKKRKLDSEISREVEESPSGQARPASDRAALPSFWLPSLTPAAKSEAVKEAKKDVVCTAAEPHHTVSVKKLVAVKFNVVDGGDGTAEEAYSCPSCTKSFTNGSKISALAVRARPLLRMHGQVRQRRQCLLCLLRHVQEHYQAGIRRGHRLQFRWSESSGQARGGVPMMGAALVDRERSLPQLSSERSTAAAFQR
ncbi:hypothetical protein DFJ74DRAFT_211624 [Hyaloraphidium curvatum]|nr:hypothetical protein DFJ74DRAFT_211624 [Hyaloraphidium curvatum]